MRVVSSNACGICPPQRKLMNTLHSLARLALGLQLLLLVGGSAFGQPTKFVILGSSSQTAGTTQNLTIRADSSGSPAASYTGFKTLIFSGADPSPAPATSPTVTNRFGSAVSFGSGTMIQFSNGLATVTGSNNGVMTLYRAQTASITVADQNDGSIGSDSFTVTVSPGSLDRFQFSLSSPQANAATFTGTNSLTALDTWGNTVTGFNASADAVTLTTTLPGTITGLGSGNNNVLNQAGDFASGIANLTGKLVYTGTVGSGTFTATSSTTKTGISGSVQINAGTATKIRVETAANGSGTLVPAQSVPSGTSVTGYAITRDVSDNFVANAAATWSLQNVTGGVLQGDLAPAGDNRSAVFTGNATGTAQMRATSGGLSAVNSGTLTVTTGAATKIRVETAADGSGTVVPAQSLSSGDSIIVYAVTRDASDNFVSNVAASWSMQDKTGGVAEGDLTPSGDNKSAKFNARLVGSARIRATAASLVVTPSGVITVNAGPATKLVITGSSTQTAGTQQNLTLTAKDAAGNTATSYGGTKSLIFSGADPSTAPVTQPRVNQSNGVWRNFGASTSITFTNGVASVSSGQNGVMQLYRAQTAVVSVTDGSIGATGSDRLTVTVSAGPLDKFGLTLTSPQTNGAPFTGTDTLAAQDSWGNTVTSFNASSDNVTLSTSLSGTISGLGSGSNNVLNRSTDFVSGVADLAGSLTYTGTTGTGTFTATSGSGKSGTSGNVTIVSSGATRLVITGSGTQVAGTSQNLTITAKDASNNTVGSYTGDKSLVFSGANPPPDPGFNPTVENKNGVAVNFGQSTVITFTNGVATVSSGQNGVMMLYNAEAVNVSVSDGTIGAFGSDRLSVTVSPAPLARFDVALSTPQTSGAPFVGVNTITAEDPYGNTVTDFNAALDAVTVTSTLGGTITGLGSGGNNVLNQAADFSSGVANLTNKMVYTGATGTGTFTATSAGGKSGVSGSVTITSGAATRLVITGSATQTAGATQNLTITAKDNSGNTVTTYGGNKNLTFSGANPSPADSLPTVTDRTGIARAFGVATSITFTNGVATVSSGANGRMRLTNVETATVSVTDGTIGSTGTDRLVVTVSPGPLGKFDFTLTSPQTNGVPFTGTNTLIARDAYGNTITTFSAVTNNVTVTTTLAGTITGLGSGNNNVLNQSGDFVSGVANLTGKLEFTGVADTGRFTATSGGKTGVSGTVRIDPAAATRLVISGGGTQTAGATQNLTITAKDSSGNTVPAYGGTKTLTFSGAVPSSNPVTQPTVTNASGSSVNFGSPTTISFLNGVATTTSGRNGVMTLYNARTDTISVTDGTLSSRGADRLVVSVTAGEMAKFIVSFDSPQTNGVPFSGVNTLTASDAYGNTRTGFNAGTDNVTLQSNLAGTISGLGSLGNNVLNQSSDFSSGVANVTGEMVFSGAGGGAIFTATSSTGKSGASQTVVMTNPVPTLTSVSPIEADRMDTVDVTLRGTKFFDGVTTVDFGGDVRIDSTKILSSTEIFARIIVDSTATLGVRDVAVVNSSPGGGTATLSAAFTVRNIPRITAIDPPTGVRGQTLVITLRGSNFEESVTTVGIIGSGISLSPPTVISRTMLTITANISLQAADGPRQLFVTNSGAYGGTSNFVAFTIGTNPIPTITSVDPDSASRLKTLEVTLRGTGFFNGLTSLNMGPGIAINSFAVDSTTRLRATITITDTASTGPRNIFVTNNPPGGGTDTLLLGFVVTNPVPTVTNIAPQVANRLQSLQVVFMGTGFISGATTVDMGPGILVDSVVVNTTTQLTASITVDSAAGVGVRDVRVLNAPPGGGSDTLANAFTINNPGAILTRIDPDTARVGTAYLDLIVEGSSFVPESIVRIDTLGLQTVFVNTTRLTATIPGSELDTAGVFAVTVFSPGAGISNSKTFTVKNPAPTLASIEPDSASRLQTLDVTMTGSGFIPGFTGVDLSPRTDIAVNSVTVTSSSELTANITVGDAAQVGERLIYVWNPVPGGGLSDSLSFRVAGNPVPVLTSVEPSTVSRLETADVVVRGANFISGHSWVDFGPGITVNSTRVDTSFQITVNITVETTAETGTRKIYVFTTAPGGGASDSLDFQIENPLPDVLSLQPSNGNQLQSLDVTLQGRNFIQGVSVVNMGPDIAIDSAVVVNDTVLSASITIAGTAALGPRDVWVRNAPPGGGADTLRNGFVVGNNPVPTLLSIEPTMGDRLALMDVLVRGTNFLGGVTTVDFGEGIIVRTATVNSDTLLTASIRIDATSPTGPHDVLLVNRPPGGGRDSIVGGFSVNNPAPSLSSVSPSRGMLDQTLDLLLGGTKFIAGVTSVNMGPDITVNSTIVDSDTMLTVSVSIGASAGTGPRNVSVSNGAPGGGQSEAVLFNVDVPGATAPVLVSPQQGATGLPLTLVLLWKSQEGASAYHVQLSTDPIFSSMVFEDSVLSDTTVQVGPLNNGATYHWRVRARFAPGYGPYSDAQSFSTQAGYPQTYTLTTTISYPNRASAAEYQPADYRIVGLPGASNLAVTSVLAGANNVDWQVYWDSGNPDESRGIIAYNGSADFTFSTGRAFWLVQKGPLTINRSVPTAELDSTGAVNIPLHSGWNIITNPFIGAVAWGTVQAGNAPVITGPIFAFNGSWSQPASFAPYAGYYFFNSDGRSSLRVPLAAPTLAKSSSLLAGLLWSIGITIQAGDFVEDIAYAGVSAEAERGLDRYDFRRPRALGPLPSVSFRRSEWDSDNAAFVTDVRPPFTDVESWDFEVYAPTRGSLLLEFPRIPDVPEEFQVFLMDPTRGQAVDLREEASYAFTPSVERSVLTLIVGTEEGVQSKLDELLPKEFALGQNFPNPFNPMTTIPVAVPQPAQVTLKIYSILGEEIRTVHQGVLSAGRHWLTWDGKNDLGVRVASGVYLSRLTTETGFSQSRKMILMK